MILPDACLIEYLEVPWVDPCEGQVTCASPDLDQDGFVGIDDFLDVIWLWGPADCFVFTLGDIDRDGEVGTEDMLIILEVWGAYDPATWDQCGCDE